MIFNQLLVDEDTSAGFADDDFLVQPYVKLALWGDGAEASTAGITLNLHDGEAVACVFADSLKGSEQPRLDLGSVNFGLFAQFGFFLLRLCENAFQFALLLVQDFLQLIH